MKKALVFSLFLISCSSYRQIEFINENMTRFSDQKKIEQNVTPKILSLPVILQNRDIASIAPLKNKKESLNNKQLYFQTLNTQMHRMGDILGKKIVNNRCPHFHSINLTVVNNLRINILEDKKNLPENTHYVNALKRPDFFPEMRNEKDVFFSLSLCALWVRSLTEYVCVAGREWPDRTHSINT